MVYVKVVNSRYPPSLHPLTDEMKAVSPGFSGANK